jgi:hypothetical protein
MSLEECHILTIGTYSTILCITDSDRESIDTILDESWSESDIGSWISDCTTEFFAMDDDTREGHTRGDR